MMVLIQLVPYLTDFLFLPYFSCLWTHLQTVYLREGRFPQGLNIAIKCIEKKLYYSSLLGLPALDIKYDEITIPEGKTV